MATKLDRGKSDPIITWDVVCAWLIALTLLGGLAFMGYGNTPFGS